MTNQLFDPVQYKLAQLKGWDSVAEGWKKWWPTFEGAAQIFSNTLVELAQLKPGQRVVDVATGIGEPAVTAAQRVGPTGKVVATDQASQMLRIAEERAKSLGLINLEFVEADAEQLEFSISNASFDAILCRLGLMYFPNLDATLARFREWLVPGGYLAAGVWNAAPKAPAISLPMQALGRELQLPPPAPGTPGPFNLGDPALLESKFKQAGFKGIEIKTVPLTFEFASAEDYTLFQKEVSAPARAIVMGQEQSRQAALWDKITEAAREYATPDGAIRIPAETLCIVGQR